MLLFNYVKVFYCGMDVERKKKLCVFMAGWSEAGWQCQKKILNATPLALSYADVFLKGTTCIWFECKDSF